MQSIVDRLRTRKLVQWGLAYLGGAWLILQVLSLLSQPFAWPALVLRAATALLGVGFLAALVVAWYHGDKGQQRVSGAELLMLGGILVIAGSAVAMVGAPVEPVTPAPTAIAPAAAPRIAHERSIAVLPFANMSSDPEQEYFSDGLTEELLNTLAQVPELRVPARTSSFAFKGKAQPIETIARELGVAYVLEGSVRKSGNRLRITAQLVRGDDGYHVWSETYDRELEDVLAVQHEVATAIVRTLHLRLGGVNDGRGAQAARIDPRAYDAYLQGLAELNERDINKALARFEEAIERDSTFARAHAALALTYLVRPTYDNSARRLESGRKGRSSADRALQLDSKLAAAYTASGALRIAYDWDFARGERELRHAIELNANDAEAHRWLAQYLAQTRRYDEAIAMARRAAELDPLSGRSVCAVSRVLTHARQFAAAIKWGERHQCAARWWAYVALGRYDAVDLPAFVANWGNPADPHRNQVIEVVTEDILGAMARGERPRTERLRLLEERGAYAPTTWYAFAGDADNALRLLEEAAEERHPDVLWITEPRFDLLRADPRYRALVAEIGLPINE